MRDAAFRDALLRKALNRDTPPRNGFLAVPVSLAIPVSLAAPQASSVTWNTTTAIVTAIVTAVAVLAGAIVAWLTLRHTRRARDTELRRADLRTASDRLKQLQSTASKIMMNAPLTETELAGFELVAPAEELEEIMARVPALRDSLNPVAQAAHLLSKIGLPDGPQTAVETVRRHSDQKARAEALSKLVVAALLAIEREWRK